jgi:hypothetical protein
MRDFLGEENARNKVNAGLYTAIMQRAMGNTTSILIGHHLCFESAGNIDTENEIPSADTLLFDHDVMTLVFGDRAVDIMQHLAATPHQSRDKVLEAYWQCLLAETAQI